MEDDIDDDPFQDEEAEEDTGAGANDDGSQGKKADGAADKEKVPRKVVRNPQPKLNPERLCGPKGIPELLRMSKDLKFKGKGHELHDVTAVLNTLKHWGHRLFPKVTSENFFERVEKLGTKRSVQGYLRRLRMGMENVDVKVKSGDDEDGVSRGLQEEVDRPREDLFESLLDRSTDDSRPDPPTAVTQRDEEARARAERNRRLAIERRLKRIAEQKSLATRGDSSSLNDSEANVHWSLPGSSQNSNEVLVEHDGSSVPCTSASVESDEENAGDGRVDGDAFLAALDKNDEETEAAESTIFADSLPRGTDGSTVTTIVPESRDLAPHPSVDEESEEILDSSATNDFTALRDARSTEDTPPDGRDSTVIGSSGTQSENSSSEPYDSENARVDAEVAKNADCSHEPVSQESVQDYNTVTMETIKNSETVSMTACSSGGLTQEMYTASEPIFDDSEPMDVE